ncbi:MAG: hypothetical protein Q4Q53_08875, partial [Methanocorpusculum sp.]|nr:hypothetical protein [Methanocorpusculum sp.]
QDRCVFEVVEERPEHQWEGIVLNIALMLQFYLLLGLFGLLVIFSIPMGGAGAGIGILLLGVPLLFILASWLVYKTIYLFCPLQIALTALVLVNLSLYILYLQADPGWERFFLVMACYNTPPTIGYFTVLLFGKKPFFSQWKEVHSRWL